MANRESSSSPYFSNLAGPTPLTASSSARLVGCRSAMASRVASEKTTNAGLDSASAACLRHSRNRSKTAWSYGASQVAHHPRAASRPTSGAPQTLHIRVPRDLVRGAGRSAFGSNGAKKRDGLRRA